MKRRFFQEKKYIKIGTFIEKLSSNIGIDCRKKKKKKENISKTLFSIFKANFEVVGSC